MDQGSLVERFPKQSPGGAAPASSNIIPNRPGFWPAFLSGLGWDSAGVSLSVKSRPSGRKPPPFRAHDRGGKVRPNLQSGQGLPTPRLCSAPHLASASPSLNLADIDHPVPSTSPSHPINPRTGRSAARPTVAWLGNHPFNFSPDMDFRSHGFARFPAWRRAAERRKAPPSTTACIHGALL